MKTFIILFGLCVLPNLATASIFHNYIAGHDVEADPQEVEVITEIVTTYENMSMTPEVTTEGRKPPHSVHVARIQWDEVKSYLITSIFLVVVCICKLAFHKAEFLVNYVPESCLLVVIGTIVGAIMYGAKLDPSKFQLSSDLFFNVLLPPIILESAYSLHDRVFFHNLGSVLLYAVIGTIANCFLLGLIDWGLAMGGAMGDIDITLTQCFVFTALIAAVDPVAVLAIFQEIGVNNVLYYLVFGESLLNDAVTVVLYNTMIEYNVMDYVPGKQVGLGFAAFFAVSLGGLAIGLIVGLFTSFFTKYTSDCKVVEPMAMFIFAYTSYILADLFAFSGIISIIGCGLVQAHYAFNNITEDSYITIKNFSQTLSTTSDCVIFMFLGMSLVSDQHKWQTGFVLWNVLLCLVLRFIITYFLTFLANLVRVRKVSMEEQFIMAYGGLRGAVAFSLVVMLDEETVPNKRLFVTTTLVIIICTGFIQGISVKPLVKLFRIRKKLARVESMVTEVNDHVTDYIMVSMETIIGNRGQNTFREKLIYYDEHYLKKWLQRVPHTKDTSIIEMHRQVSVHEYMDKMA